MPSDMEAVDLVQEPLHGLLDSPWAWPKQRRETFASTQVLGCLARYRLLEVDHFHDIQASIP